MRSRRARRRAWRTRSRSTARARGAWHVGDPPDQRATAAARRRGIDARGRRAAGHARGLRALRPAARRRPRERRRPAARSRPTTAARAKVRLLREFDPASAGAPDLDVPDPYYGGDGRLRGRARPWSRPPAAACSTSCGEPAAGRDVRSRRGERRRRSTTRTTWSSPTAAGRSSRPAPTRGPASSRPRRPAWPGWPSRAPCACRRCSRSTTATSRSSGSSRARWTRRARRSSAAGWRACTRPARRRAPERRRCGSARSSSTSRPPATGPTFYAERLVRPLLAPRRGRRATRSTACATGMAEFAGPDEPPARLHGDLWSGNVLADARRAPVADRPRRLRRPPRGRPRDAAAVRRPVAARARRLRGGRARCADGHEDRVELWQLFPLLIHAVLFGGGYGGSRRGRRAPLRRVDLGAWTSGSRAAPRS